MNNLEALKELQTLVKIASTLAEMFAFSTVLTPLKDELKLPEFRASAGNLSKPFPTLRPILGRMVVCLEVLSAADGVELPHKIPSRVLFSDVNPRHMPWRDFSEECTQFYKEADSILCSLVR